MKKMKSRDKYRYQPVTQNKLSMTTFQRLSGFSFESVLSSFSAFPDLMVLQSARVHPTDARYSYLCVNAFAQFTAKEGEYTWNGEGIACEDPWRFIQDICRHYHVPRHPELPPFQGGAVGYFGYEFARTLEVLPQVIDGIGLPDCVLNFYHQVIAFDHVTSTVLLMGNPRDIAALGAQLKAGMIQKIQGSLSGAIHSNFDETRYCKAVAYLKACIRRGDMFEANLTQQFQARLVDEVDAVAWYWALTQRNPAPMSAFMRLSEEVYLLSSSPERFVSLLDRQVTTEPIKGTRKRVVDVEEDRKIALSLLESEKDQAENVMIVDLMRNDLSRVCLPGTVKVPELCVLKTFETVHHLVSTVTGRLKPGLDAVDVLKATFPPGSVTGAPKVKAMELISEVEQTARGPYCGCLGYISFTGEMDMAVIIRTYVVNQQQVYLGAGGAVVLDSDEQAEYAESLAKAGVLREVLYGSDS